MQQLAGHFLSTAVCMSHVQIMQGGRGYFPPRTVCVFGFFLGGKEHGDYLVKDSRYSRQGYDYMQHTYILYLPAYSMKGRRGCSLFGIWNYPFGINYLYEINYIHLLK